MIFRCCTALLMASTVFGQAKPAAQTAASDTNTPVITIKGLCAPATSKGKAAPCQTLVKRADFERIAKAVQPKMSPQWRRQFATSYARMMILSAQARRQNLQKDPRFVELTRLAQMQILQQLLGQKLQAESERVPEADIQKYFNDNQQTYEEAEFLRIYVPKLRSPEPGQASVPPPKAEDRQRDEALMKDTADALQKRAAAGEDFDKLQEEGFETARMQMTPPTVKVGKVTRAGLPATHVKAFDLKPGKVSPVFAEGNGYYIYKMLSSGLPPLKQVHDSIRTTLQGKRFQDSMQQAMKSATPEFDEKYFAVPTQKPQAAPVTPQPATPEKDRDDD